jgi:hypothetical protein
LVQFALAGDFPESKMAGAQPCSGQAGRLAKSFLLCSKSINVGGWLMDIEKQREIIRLWNLMRRVEGPIAEEIRIQILEYFAQQERTKRAA